MFTGFQTNPEGPFGVRLLFDYFMPVSRELNSMVRGMGFTDHGTNRVMESCGAWFLEPNHRLLYGSWN